MTPYERIKQRRIELGMSQDELAKKVGYKGRSMMSRIERGDVDLSASKIKQIADALNTTPGYLLKGCDTSSQPDAQLTSDEMAVIEWYRKAPEHDRDFLRRMMAYSDHAKKDTEPKAI